MFEIKYRNMQVDNVTNSDMENKGVNPTENIVCAIDIGTSKIAALVGRKNQFGKIEILGIGNCPSFGVQRGVVVNIAKTVESIQKAVADAERQSGIRFQKVHVGIAGQHIKSLQHRGILTRSDNESWISYDDIQKLKNEMYKLALPPGDKILHVLPQEYIVDNEQGIHSEPVGMMGVRLEGKFHIITGAETAIKNIERCINVAGLEVASIELEPLASADAVLSKEELEGGVCLVDIGGGTTDIAIFENFVIRHTAVISLGGDTITNDLKDFRILRDQAEALKKTYGNALPYEELRNQHVTIQGEGGIKAIGRNEVNLLAVSKVISARMREILAHVAFEINLSGFEKKLIGGIVLTGGGSKLKHLVQLTESETGQTARLGFPREHLASTKITDVDNPIYATGIGLLFRGFKIKEEQKYYQVEVAEKQTAKVDEIQVTDTTITTPIGENEVINISEETEKPTATKINEQPIKQDKVKAGKDTKKISIFSSWKSKVGSWIESDFEDFENK